MCLLCYIAPDADINWNGLETACRNNPDGFGWSLHLGDRLLVGRSMSSDVALQTFYDARMEHPGAHAMFHARWATHGTTDLSNCHPFHVGNTTHTVLGHNGVLPITATGTESDTAIFARKVLPRRGVKILDHRRKLADLETWLGGSKLVVFTTLQKMRQQVYIVNEHRGDWADGTWWSNDSYIPNAWDLRWATYDDDTCPTCQRVLTEDDITCSYCWQCGTCLDCGSIGSECMCYQPAN